MAKPFTTHDYLQAIGYAVTASLGGAGLQVVGKVTEGPAASLYVVDAHELPPCTVVGVALAGHWIPRA